jgi:hypothetical protein
MRILASVVAMFISTSIASASELTDFSGKYKFQLVGLFSDDQIELLINRSNQVKVVRYTGDEALGIPQVQMAIHNFDNQLGPLTLPIASLYFVIGSDEETHTFVVRMVNEMNPTPALVLVDSIYTINDGPNSIATVRRNAVKAWRWNKETKSYESLKK